jgi:hypothetical protein
MLAIYVLILGIVFTLMGIIEVIVPLKTFGFWKKWVSGKLFFLHGLLIIAAGFPLTIYKGPLSPVLFIFGLIAVLTGPFVLIYPEKIRQMFMAMAKETRDADMNKIIYVEGFLRISAGIICIISYALR